MKRFFIWLLILTLGTMGCWGIQAQTPLPSPTQASPPLQPTAETTKPPTRSPTVPPTLPPTELPTKQPNLQIQPKAGATFSGPIQIGKDKAGSGTLSFTVSENGTMITSVLVGFKDFKCESMSASEFSTSSSGEFLITDDWDFSLSNLGQIQGRFTSPTTASGTITLNIEIKVMSSTISCDMGTWEWSAEAQ